jgi:uncharacterized lipoprotein NlpE involved in copper resistance
MTGRGALALLAVVAVILVGCDEAEEALEDATERAQDTEQMVRYCTAALELGQAVRDQDEQQAVDAAGTAAENAPDEIADEAEQAHQGAQRLADGDHSVLEDEEFRAAVEAVSTHAREECDPTN